MTTTVSVSKSLEKATVKKERMIKHHLTKSKGEYQLWVDRYVMQRSTSSALAKLVSLQPENDRRDSYGSAKYLVKKTISRIFVNSGVFVPFQQKCIQSNLCTTTTLGTPKLWPLLTGGLCSEVPLCYIK